MDSFDDNVCFAGRFTVVVTDGKHTTTELLGGATMRTCGGVPIRIDDDQ